MNNILKEFSSSDVKLILDGVPTVSDISDFKYNLEVGDIIISNLDISKLSNSYFSKKFVTLNNKLLRFFQKQPYSSCKMYVGDNLVCGYGVSGHGFVGLTDFDNWSEKINKACLVRVNTATKLHRKLATKTLLKTKGLTYKNSLLLTSLVRRNIKTIDLIHDNDVEMSLDEKQEAAEQLTKPTICSVILAAAYISQGVHLKFGNLKLNEIWPVDFVMSPQTDKIVKLGE